MGAFRILIVDDHDAVRRGVRSLLSTRAEWSVCGEAMDGLEAIQKVKELRPDVVLMDVSMPRMNGIEATRIIRREVPECHVIMVSQNDPSILVRQTAEVDARGYVLKADIARDLFPALEKALGSRNGNTTDNLFAETTRKISKDLLFGGGRLGELIRQHDWSKTPLGPIQSWPQSLRTAVNLMLNSQHPMWIGWGKEMTFLYNDAYVSVLSQAKHPGSLGRPAREVWAEIWDICGPLAEKVFAKAEPSFLDDVHLFMNRGDYLEETYYSFSYSPIYDETGKIAGLFCPSAETTAKVLNARRLKTLSKLSANALVERSVPAACASALATLSGNLDDIPFSLLYLLDADGKRARLQSAGSLPESLREIAQQEIALGQDSQDAQFWRVNEVVDTCQAQVVSVKGLRALPLGPALQPVAEAIVLPVTSRGQDRPVAVLIAGINPARPLDVEYRTFYTLVADQIATAIQNASAAEEEKRRIEALAEIDRAKTVFFSNVSHEFRTPLTLMLAPLEDALAESQDLPGKHRERLEVAHRNSVRLLKLVNTLLDFSRIESGRTQATYEPVDLAAYTAELASVFRSVIESAGLRLIVRCEELPKPLYVDREMWEKIVFNLLSNAFKFTFEGEIEIVLRRVGEDVELSVHDTGTGIPPEEIQHLFERFHRVKGAHGRTFEGSGIGLALVQELALLHGGRVRAESKMDHGSTFFVRIPLDHSHLPPDRISTAQRPVQSGVSASAYIEEALHWNSVEDVLKDEFSGVQEEQNASEDRPRVLLADDNADMREYVRKLLAAKYEVEAVADGQALLQAARRKRPDLVLADVMMPELDGFAVLRSLRTQTATATVPVILLSARAGEESRVEGMAAGADDYLVKPFSARELMARIDTHIRLARLRQEADARIRHSEEELQILHRVGAALASELDLKKVVQSATDAGRELSEAEYGAFFYNNIHSNGEKALPYTSSVASGDQFEKFGLPDNAAMLAPTFAEARTVRLDDLRKDPHYVRSAPKQGASSRRLQVRSYLAVPVVSRSGEVIGSLVYGHHETGVFTERAERLVEGVARQAAIAIDNARLFEAAQFARKKAQKSVERLRAIFDSSAVGVAVLALDGRFVEVNNALCEITGYSQEELKTRDAAALIHPEDRPKTYSLITRLIAGEIPNFLLEERCLKKDGETVWTHKSISLTRDLAGKPENLVAVCQDISQRKKAEQAYGLVTAIVESSDDAIITKNLDGIVTSWNKGAERIFGYAAQEAIGQHITFIIPPELHKEEAAIIERLRKGERVEHFETIRMRKDGERRNISLSISPVKDASGRVVGASKVARDVTERRQAEERERRMMAEAIAANAKFRAVFEQTSVFAGIMSNDGTLIETNRLSLDDCGYSPEEVLGKPFWECPWWRNFPEMKKKIRTAATQASQGIPFREILHYSWADGTERLVDFALHPIQDEEERVLFLHPTGVDITDLKRTEENYRRLAESLDAEVRLRTRELEERNTDVIRQSEQLRDLSAQLMRIQDEERRHIARELHDSAGQTLTALSMELAKLRRDTDGRRAAMTEGVEQCEEFVQQLMREIRTTSYLLHPPLLDESGLSAALSWYVRGLAERSILDIRLNMAEDFGRLPRDMELAIFRLVQECLTNVHRHSGSDSATISIFRDSAGIKVEVQDRGKGIPAEKLAAIQSHAAGVGIRGMRERVRQFQGELDIQSTRSGTRISVNFPLRPCDIDEGERDLPLGTAV